MLSLFMSTPAGTEKRLAFATSKEAGRSAV
jgi:hypothetical protein